jgi:hypothetical protein
MSHSAAVETYCYTLSCPFGLFAGFADYLSIELHGLSGYKESLLHLLVFTEVAIPLLAAIFFEINALIIAPMIAGFVVHQLTALWDTFASHKWRITPIEQQVHSFL